MANPSPDDADPFAKFHTWMAAAIENEPIDPNAMTVVTATPDGRPSARVVLLKGVDDRGFVFYTNKESRKADELAANPRVFLLFYWKSLGRQIRVEGVVEHVTNAESDAYFATRARISRLGAWASMQSRPLAERSELERRLADYEARYPGEDIPRPPYWSGYRVLPESFEFWQLMPYRLHDRTIYSRASGAGGGGAEAGGGWTIGKLFP
jgi:pyridoxamine 5'-phosphate oxidase